MHCTIPNCQSPVVVREPIPLCGVDGARIVVAYGQAHLADPVPVDDQAAEDEAPAEQMTEQQALGVIAAAADSITIRDLANLTGWSVGWVHARRRSL